MTKNKKMIARRKALIRAHQQAIAAAKRAEKCRQIERKQEAAFWKSFED